MGFLLGKTAVVTGGGRAVLSDGGCGSIGYGIAVAYAKEGANLVITGRNVKKLEDAKEELERLYGVNVLPVQADVSKDGDNERVVRNVVDRAVETFGGIDVLINNAQASASGITLADHTTEQFDLAVYSGLYATFYYMKACYPYLKKSKGTVINFASGAGLFGNFGQCAYAAAKEGTLELPRSYTIHSGVPVGKWLELQRQVQAGQRPGRLTAEQAAKLEKLGIRWNHRLEAAWEKGFASAQKYRTEHGDLLVPVRYRDKNDFALGEWIVYNRQRYLGGNLTQNRIERLEAIGMVWSTSNDLWEQNYAAATQYYLEHGDLEVPIKYETPSGFGLGVWLGAQRAAHKAGELPQEQVERLDALGMDWTNRNDRKWMSLYDVAAAYYHEHGSLNVPSEYVTPDGVLLGKWVARQRYAYLNPDRSSARVTPERKALLDKLGMVWEKYDPWQERYDLALAYKTEHGDLEIPSVYKTADGVWLGSWVNRQRQALNSGSSALSSERRKLLRTLFKGERRPSDPAADHGTVREANWERNFRSAARYARKYKHLLVPASYVDSDGVRLGVWISNLRAARKNRPDSYQVTPAHIKKLNSIGMVWDARDAKWGTAYQQAKAYYKAHGNLHAAANYKSDETGFCLGDWLRRMREWDTTHDPKLTPERRAMLDKIGMEWSE